MEITSYTTLSFMIILWASWSMASRIEPSVVCLGNWWDTYNLDAVGVVTVPVADMLAQAAQSAATYQQLPFTTDASLGMSTARVHQCIYNELLFNLSASGNLGIEYGGTVPQAFYGIDTHDRWINHFFTHKNYVKTLSELKKAGADFSLIPPPVDYSRSKRLEKDTVLTLIKPWYDAQTKRWYSVGTRFVRKPVLDTQDTYSIAFINYQTCQCFSAQIPRDQCLVSGEIPAKSSTKKELLVTLIRCWINQAAEKGGRIAYVLGGSTFAQTYAPLAENVLEPVLIDKSIAGADNAFVIPWQPITQLATAESNIWTGFDCSELIWRAAHMVGFDYKYKNTRMISLFLKALGDQECPEKSITLAVGDLLWMPGHVMLISDVEKGLIIESAGYQWPVGQVHEVQLEEVFENIKSYADVLEAYAKRVPLIRKGFSGKKVAYDEYEFFRF